MVNFDPVRAEAALNVFARFAGDHQILLFTCHPETVERVRATSPGAKVIDLPRP